VGQALWFSPPFFIVPLQRFSPKTYFSLNIQHLLKRHFISGDKRVFPQTQPNSIFFGRVENLFSLIRSLKQAKPLHGSKVN